MSLKSYIGNFYRILIRLVKKGIELVVSLDLFIEFQRLLLFLRIKFKLLNYMNNFHYTYIVLCYLSSKLVVAAEFTTMSISFHISSLNIESSIPKLSWQMLPEIGVTFSNIKDSRFAPKFSLRTLNKSFPNTCKYGRWLWFKTMLLEKFWKQNKNYLPYLEYSTLCSTHCNLSHISLFLI